MYFNKYIMRYEKIEHNNIRGNSNDITVLWKDRTLIKNNDDVYLKYIYNFLKEEFFNEYHFQLFYGTKCVCLHYKNHKIIIYPLDDDYFLAKLFDDMQKTSYYIVDSIDNFVKMVKIYINWINTRNTFDEFLIKQNFQ